MIASKRTMKRKTRKPYIDPFDRLSALEVCTCGRPYDHLSRKCKSCGRKVKS